VTAGKGVYRILADGKKLDLIVEDISMPNGIAFSPDEKVLYVSDTFGSNIVAFDILPDGRLVNRRVFTNVAGYPDGMKVDMKGNLYITTGSVAVRVYDKDGKQLGRIEIPEATTNCAFGGIDGKTLFVTTRTSLYRLKLKVQGVPVVRALK